MACDCDAIVSNLIDISLKLDNLGTMMTKISEIEARLNQIETRTQGIKQDTEGLGQTVKDNNNLIQNWIDRNVDSLENGVSRILDSLENGVNRIINGVDGLSSAIDLVSNIVSTGFQALTTIVNGVGSLLTGIRDFLSGGNSDHTERVLNAIGDVSNQVRQIPTNDAERILNALTGVGIEIERIANNTGDIILGNSQIYETVRLIPTNDAERILNALGGVDQILRSHSDSLADIIRRLIEGVNVDLSPVLSAIDRTENTVRFESNKILAALALIKLTDLVGSILNGIKDILHQDKVDILEILANLTTLIQAIKGNEPVDLSPVLSAIDRIPTNDAERVLNSLSAVRETQSYHSDQQAEIIRRLAIQSSDILNQLNETKNIINETNVDLSPVLNAIERTEGTVRGEATKILLAIAALKFSDLVGSAIDGIKDFITKDRDNILGGIADLITIANAIKDSLGKSKDDQILELLGYYDRLRWEPTANLTREVWNEFRINLAVTVDLSNNMSDGSVLQEYKNPGMRGIERMLQGVVAKLEIMELNAGKTHYPIIHDSEELESPVEFSNIPDALSYLFSVVDKPAGSNGLLRIIYDRLGLARFPVEVPAKLTVDVTQNIDPDSGVVGSQTLPNDLSIGNMTDLMAWFVSNWEDNLGGWGKEIVVQDTSLTESGDQTTSISLPSMSEAIAELVQLSVQNYINGEALLQVATKALIEAGQSKIEAIKGQRMSEAIAEYLGFEQQEKEIDIVLSFNPPIDEGTSGRLEDFDNLATLLTERTIKVAVMDNTEKIPFSDSLDKLLHAAAVVRAVYWEETGFDNIGSRMKALAVRAQEFPNPGELTADLLRKVADSGESEEDGEKLDDFDIWLNRAEGGFIDEAGISDPVNPYGREFDRRPRIRKIGNPNSQTTP